MTVSFMGMHFALNGMNSNNGIMLLLIPSILNVKNTLEKQEGVKKCIDKKKVEKAKNKKKR